LTHEPLHEHRQFRLRRTWALREEDSHGVTRYFTYDGWKPILEWCDWGGWLAWNVYGAGSDEILARHDWAGGNWIYKQDKQSSVVAVLDGNGTVAEKYHYDAFGQPTVTD